MATGTIKNSLVHLGFLEASEPLSSYNDGVTIFPTYVASGYPFQYGLVLTLKSYRGAQFLMGLHAIKMRWTDNPTATWSEWEDVL